MSHMKRITTETSGQDLIEYALLVGAIALAILVGVEQLGVGVAGRLNGVRAAAFPENGISYQFPPGSGSGHDRAE